MTAACLLAGLVLAGCSRQTQFTYEGSRLESMARDLQENAQADSFAKNLCVVTGEEGEEDASVTAEAAAAFGIDSKQVIFQKNSFERLYPASITKIMTALAVVFWFAILTGWGLRHETDEELAADGIVIENK